MNAQKIRFGATEAVALARAKAKRVVGPSREFDLAKDNPTDEDLAGAMLGPTGNLKAPTILVGTTLIVGFNEAAYDKYLR